MSSPVSERLLLSFVPRLGYLLIRFLGLTIRIKEIDRPRLAALRRRGGIIYVFWHARLLMMPLVYTGGSIYVLISRHRDGELIRRVVSFFGFRAIRGSSTHGGGTALKKLATLLKEGYDVAITPDGPRGPAEVIKPGVINLAAKTGRPVVPITFSASPRWRAGSWDGFVVPLPFARGTFLWGKPTWIAEGDDLEAKRLELENNLNDITSRADEMYGGRRR